MGFFLSLVLLAVTLLLSELFKPKVGNEHARPADLGDFNFPTATEGRPVPIVWGTVKLSGPNVVWSGDLRPQAITTKIKTGLFSSKRVTTGYRYRMGIQLVFSRGPVDSLRRIWVDEEELWSGDLTTDGTININEPDFFGGEDNGSGGIVGPVSVRLGSQSQTVPDYLAEHQSYGGQTPAYRGNFYLLLERVLLGTSTSIRPWAAEVRRIPNGLSLGPSERAVNDGNDANPMNVIYEILTNTEWGLGFPSADVDTVSFAAAATVLASEGNGVSLVLDSPREITDLLNEILRQIDGVVFLNRQTGKWDVKLARNDYDIDTVPQASPSNIVGIEDYTRGSWAETQNVVLVQFTSRVREYQLTYAPAQDMANIRIQGGQVVKAELRFPGVKDSALASQIAWRELRVRSYPLAKAKLVVDRSFADVNPGDVIAWTDPDLGFTKLPMRVLRADFGELAAGRITLDVMQDVFQAAIPAFVAPGAGNWIPPVNTVGDIPSQDRLLFDAPRAFIDRDPDQPGLLDRFWAGFRSQDDGALNVTLKQSSDQLVVGSVGGFLLVGQLASSLSPAYTTSGTLTVEAAPDSKAELLGALAAASDSDVGESLANLILVGSEFMAFTGFSDPGGDNITLTGVVRGMLDSVPPLGGHAAGTRVWFIHLAGALSDTAFPGSSSVTVRPIPKSDSDELLFSAATNSVVSLSSRARRPYPPINPRSGATSLYGATLSIDSTGAVSGSGHNGRGIPLTVTRRDWRLADERAKVVSETVLPADFPSAHATEYRLAVRDGASTPLYTGDWGPASSLAVSRNRVLAANSGLVPSSLEVSIETRHVLEGVTYAATYNLEAEFSVTSSLSGWTPLGALTTNVVSTLWVAPATGTYDVDIGDAVPSGAFQVRINGGSWTDVVTGANTTGSFAATAADQLEFRHTGTATPDQYRFAEIEAPSSDFAYAILIF